MKKRQDARAFDLVIAGGGAAGLTLAILAGQAGCRTAVIDKAPAPAPLAKTRPSGRTVALMQASLAILAKTGAWAGAAPYGATMKTMRLIDDSGARLLPGAKVDFHASEAGFPCFGVNIPVSFLRAALWERAMEIGAITLLPETGFRRYAMRTASIEVQTDDETLGAQLLVAADGARSMIREQAQIPCTMRDYGRKAITCLIRHSRPHLNVSTEFHRPSGPFALVPLQGLMSSVVWVEDNATADALLALPRKAFETALQEKTGGIVGDIALESVPESWPLRALRARRLTAPRVALVAESAHTMSPITAQGLNLSLRDVDDLATAIARHRMLGFDLGGPALLYDYEKSRRADVLTRTAGVDALMRLVSTENRLPRLLRRGAMQAVSLLPPLRKLAILSGMGLRPSDRAA